MLCDLNVLWPKKENSSSKIDFSELDKLLMTLTELKYTHVALNYVVTPENVSDDEIIQMNDYINSFYHKYFKDITIPKIKLYTRITIMMEDPSKMQNVIKKAGTACVNNKSTHSGPSTKSNITNNTFDIIAIMPLNEKSLHNISTNLDCSTVDLITFDYNNPYAPSYYFLKHKTISGISAKGIKIEIIYAPMLSSTGNSTVSRVKYINNVKQIIRCSGRNSCKNINHNNTSTNNTNDKNKKNTSNNKKNNLIISSGAANSLQVRNKLGVYSIMMQFNGMKNYKGVTKLLDDNPLLVLLNGRLRKKSYQQCIVTGDDVIADTQIGISDINGFAVRQKEHE
ncbi:uncharacterized protein SCODWIG_01617 [Saccharomycodes ludwigii]|uniref:Uncharacterized protein n=1 Tax=Saccharomycodes ludwigii TaxID=36035 RepID=A0A376B599_9ASCO|nr:hypothetical protein SCDLUD_004643 [Saccharomycodes ludwigii]KAH3899212.1 hypothetical protein SCDLUD_004643 [Saccharomycodes ludwigii]SSD59856.1 uncharacterized protein SCODWIG_01617 [Saccharomycodes ludwigii]